MTSRTMTLGNSHGGFQSTLILLTALWGRHSRTATPILHMRKWRLRAVKWLLQGHTDNKQQSQRLSRGLKLYFFLQFQVQSPCSSWLSSNFLFKSLASTFLPAAAETSSYISHFHWSQEELLFYRRLIKQSNWRALATLHFLMTVIITSK